VSLSGLRNYLALWFDDDVSGIEVLVYEAVSYFFYFRLTC